LVLWPLIAIDLESGRSGVAIIGHGLASPHATTMACPGEFWPQKQVMEFRVTSMEARPIDKLRFRALWAFLATAEHGSTNRAARSLNLTQPAVSQAITLLEKQLGMRLFNRRAKGLVPTELGNILIQRVQLAKSHLLAAENEIARATSNQAVKEHVKGLHRRITRKHLSMLVSVAENRSVQYAAQADDCSQSIIWHALRELKNQVGEALVEHRPSGAALSLSGEILVRYAKLAFAEMRHAQDDFAATRGNLSGRVIIGALPLSRTMLLPRAISQLALRYPNLEFTLVDGPYGTLLSALRQGDVDVIVGALRAPAPADDVIEETLFHEPLSIAAGALNPLVKRRNLSLASLATRQWVLPIRGTPTRSIFESLFIKNGLTPPIKVIESASLIATRALLLESDYITLISRSQIYYEEKFNILAALDVKGLADTERPIGVTTRAAASHSPGLRELIQLLHIMSGELYKQPSRVSRRGARPQA